MKNRIISLLILLSLALSAFAQRKAIERTTDVLCVAPTATAALAAIVKHDKKGFLQLTLSSATSLAVNCGLELAIKKERSSRLSQHPYHSGFQRCHISYAALWMEMGSPGLCR